MNSNDNRLDRIEAQIEANARQIAQTQQQVDANSRAVATLIQSLQQFIAVQQQESQQFNQSINSINAALERIDRVMDYLLRQQGNAEE